MNEEEVTEEVAKENEPESVPNNQEAEKAMRESLKKLEEQVADLEKENESLKQTKKAENVLSESLKKLEEKVFDLENEKEYLKQKIVERTMFYDTLKSDMKERFGYDSDEEAEIYYQNLLKEDEKLTCDVCTFVGKTEAGLRTHKTIKHKVKCENCNKRVDRKEDLEEHFCSD